MWPQRDSPNDYKSKTLSRDHYMYHMYEVDRLRPATLNGAMSHGKLALLCLALMLAVLVPYANHFDNGFHFDDFHTVTGNPSIRDLHNIPRFFTDPATF